jgi:peptidoglycan hydrolase CwlO-like protein
VHAVGAPTSRPLKARNNLTNSSLKSCQAREDSIKTRLSNLIRLATNMQEKFDSIASRVEEYYTTKIVPSGKTVANYDALVADMAAKKSDVQTAITKAQSNVDDFSCDGDDPRTQMNTFRTDMQAVKQELKDYRTSIKNLIVAVRSVTGKSETEKPSPTPES